MKCPEVLESLSDYIDDELDSDRGDEMDIHLESCPDCKGYLNIFERTMGFCRDTAVPPLDEETLDRLSEEALKGFKKAFSGKT